MTRRKLQQTELFSLGLSDAVFSADRTYRYRLDRTVGAGPRVLAVIGLNPSTADETTDDPTIRRLIGFARSWGYDRLVMTNLFAYRSTEPARLLEVADPVGPDNDAHLAHAVSQADLVLAAWGVGGGLLERGDRIRRRFHGHLHCLGVTKDGQPRHPLYLAATCQPVPLS